MAKTTRVYLIEYQIYDDYQLLGCYDTLEAAISHANDPNFIKKHGDWKATKEIFTSCVTIREVGVRSRTQFSPIHEGIVTPNTQVRSPA